MEGSGLCEIRSAWCQDAEREQRDEKQSSRVLTLLFFLYVATLPAVLAGWGVDTEKPTRIS